MEDRILDLEQRVNQLAEDFGSSLADEKDIADRLTALEHAVATLSNTLHVIDSTSLLCLYSLIQTNNLKQPNFESNQDIIDSGCSDAINRMMKTIIKVNAAEAKDKHGEEDKSEGR